MCLIPAEGDASYVDRWIPLSRDRPTDGQECLVRTTDGREPRIAFTYLASEDTFCHPEEDFEYKAEFVTDWFPFKLPQPQ